MITPKFLIVSLLLLTFFACRKELSNEDNKQVNSGTLPSDYPFATGYCEGGGTSLGITISDTDYYIPANTSFLPASLLLNMPTPGNQGSQGSCTAWATVYGLGSYYQNQMTGRPYSDTANLSPKFTYNQIAKGSCGCTSLLDNLYLLKTQGASSLNSMPYNPSECSKQPDSLQRKLAELYKIKGWQKVDLHNLTTIKQAIVERKPVLFAIRVDEGFSSISSPYIWKARAGALRDGHALIIVGYDDSKKAFRIMNSWSTAWGDGGFAWIDYDFFLKNVIEGGYIVI
jgi:C1A family cysteine protease